MPYPSPNDPEPHEPTWRDVLLLFGIGVVLAVVCCGGPAVAAFT